MTMMVIGSPGPMGCEGSGGGGRRRDLSDWKCGDFAS